MAILIIKQVFYFLSCSTISGQFASIIWSVLTGRYHIICCTVQWAKFSMWYGFGNSGVCCISFKKDLWLDTNEHDMVDGEETTLYHLLRTTKRREARMIRQIQDQRSRTTDDRKEISHFCSTQERKIWSCWSFGELCCRDAERHTTHCSYFLRGLLLAAHHGWRTLHRP